MSFPQGQKWSVISLKPEPAPEPELIGQMIGPPLVPIERDLKLYLPLEWPQARRRAFAIRWAA